MKEFKFITHANHDPYFNLASEEFLLKHTEGFYIYLWINAPSVIVGVNQNAIEEVNLTYTDKNGIKVVRRLTGGGAVYHDYNNLCYTVIAPYEEGENQYKKFSAPVIEYLNSIGVYAEFSGRNDLLIDGKKFSGNAQTVYKNRIMHHGTLLFDSDLSVLEKALNPNKLKMESKGIKSVRSRVTTIRQHLKQSMTIEQFKEGLSNYFLANAIPYEFTENDLQKINQLVKEKYSQFSWNVGNSPKGNNVFEKKYSFGVFKLVFDTAQGKVQNAVISGDFFTKKDVKELAEKLNGVEFTKSGIESVLNEIADYVYGADAKTLIEDIFS